MLVETGMLADAFDGNQGWVLIGLAVVALIYMAVIRPTMRKRQTPPSATPGFAALSRQRGVEQQMQSLLVELSDMARQMNAQIDSRAAKLEVLLQEADQKIASLQSTIQSPAAPIALNSSDSAPPSAPSEEPQMPDPRHAEVYSLADQGQDAPAIANQLGRPRGEVELILALRGRG